MSTKSTPRIGVDYESLTILFIVSFFLSFSLSPFFSLFLSVHRKTYYRTDPKEWTKIHANGDNARIVEPVPFTDDDEEFTVNITPAEVESLKDEAGDVRFSKVIVFCLPRFDDTEGGKICLWE